MQKIENHSSIKNQININQLNVVEKPSIFNQNLPSKKGCYLPRICASSKEDGFRFIDENTNRNKNTLRTRIENHERIVLLADAGMGKSTELIQLAHNLEAERKKVRYYKLESDKPIPNNQASEEEGYILIDGLDEVRIEHAKNKIIQLASNYTNCKLIVACRANIYNDTLAGGEFKTLFLRKLIRQDIEDYLQCRIPSQAKSFWKLLPDSEIKELIYIPFYLERIIEYFEKEKSFPKNRCTLIQYLLDKSLKIRLEERYASIQNEQLRKECRAALSKVAFVMECLGKNSISRKELFEILDSDSSEREYELIFRKSSLVSYSPDSFSFTHLIFQEFLAAEHLSGKSFSKIQNILSIELNEVQCLRPHWSNTIALLMDLLKAKPEKQKELIYWLEKIHPTQIFAFELGSINLSKTEKARIFLTHFQILLDRNEHYQTFIEHRDIEFIKYNKIAFKKLVEYLNGDNPLARRNALKVISNCKNSIPKIYKKEIEAYIKAIIETGENTELLNYAIEIKSSIQGFQADELRKLFEKRKTYSDEQNFRERYTIELLDIIAENKLQNELVDVLFEFSCKKFLRKNFEFSKVANVLSKLDKEESIYQFFQLFLTIKSIKKDNYYNIISTVLEKQEGIINFSNKILQQLLQIVIEVRPGYRERNNIKNKIVTYLKKTEQEIKAIGILLESSEKISKVQYLIVKLIREEQLDVLVTLLLDNDKNLDDFSRIARCIYYNHRQLFESFLKKANLFLDNKLKIVIDDTQKQKTQNEEIEHELTLEALFDKDKCLIEIERIFGEHQFLDEVWDKDTWENKRAYSRFICRLIYEIKIPNNKPLDKISKEEIISHIKEHWECCISINAIIRYLEQLPDLKLDDDKIEFIRKRCEKEITENNYSRGLVFFAVKFNFFDFPKNFYKYMTTQVNPFQREGTFGSKELTGCLDFIHKNNLLTSDELQNCVIDNLSKLKSEQVLIEPHLEFCRTHQIQEVNLILLEKIPTEEYHQKDMLDTYIHLNGDLESLEEMLEDTDNKNLKYLLLETFLKQGYSETEAIIKELFKQTTDESDKIQYAKCWLHFEEPSAIAHLISVIREKRFDIIHDRPLRLNRETSWTNLQLIPLALELFHLEQSLDSFDNPSIAPNILYDVALKDGQFEQVRNLVLEHLETTRTKITVADSEVTAKSLEELEYQWGIVMKDYIAKKSKETASIPIALDWYALS